MSADDKVPFGFKHEHDGTDELADLPTPEEWQRAREIITKLGATLRVIAEHAPDADTVRAAVNGLIMTDLTDAFLDEEL